MSSSLRQSTVVSRRAVASVLAWVEEQRDYCRPPELRHLDAEELAHRRGPCAAYGAVVYELTAAKLREVLAASQQ